MIVAHSDATIFPKPAREIWKRVEGINRRYCRKDPIKQTPNK